jgi:hypothetical protein
MVGGLVSNQQPPERNKTMTRPKRNDETINLTKQELLRALTGDDALKKLMQTLLQEVLEAEMDQALQAGRSERAPAGSAIAAGITPVRW